MLKSDSGVDTCLSRGIDSSPSWKRISGTLWRWKVVDMCAIKATVEWMWVKGVMEEEREEEEERATLFSAWHIA
jgi:hypothetical protein